MPHRLSRVLSLALLAAAALAASATPVRAHGLAMSLYDQLGGVYGIAPVVDYFVDRLWSDPVMIANPYVAEARQRYAKASLRFLLTEYLCDKTGGPMVYRGRDLKTAHAGLRISEKEWQAMLADLKASLRKFGVSEESQWDLIEVIEGTKKDIVVGTAPAAPAPAAPPGGDVHQHE
jgi:hemoglobin